MLEFAFQFGRFIIPEGSVVDPNPLPDGLRERRKTIPPSPHPETCSFHRENRVGTRDFSVCERFFVLLGMVLRTTQGAFSIKSALTLVVFKDFDDNILSEIPELRCDLKKSATIIPGVVL
jgi:hypothetical protein